MLRFLCRALAALLLFSGCATESARAVVSPPAPPAPDQIRWQRTLEDALAIAKVRHRPLLLAINMDGESASDRIYSERYRDPAFVAASRHCVCLCASVFRHNARDHDDQGRRVPCPRFGEITCGEHMALEPVLFEKYLSDGDRVAPRHALIREDGTKAWDLSLCFDLKDVDRALLGSVGDAPVTADDAPLPQEHRQRLAAEDALVAERDGAEPPGLWLAGLTRHGDPAAVEGLRRLVPELRAREPLSIDFGVLPELFAPAVIACGLAAPIGRDVWDALQRAEGAHAAALLDTLTSLAAAEPSLWFQVHAHRALAAAGAPSLASLSVQAAEVTKKLANTPRAPRATGDEMRPGPELEREIEEVERQLAKNTDDAALHARFAKASLDLGRQAIEGKQKNARFLLEDAAMHWKKAVARDTAHFDWWVESARTAYFLEDFAGEAEFGRRALAIATGKALGELPSDAMRIDAHTAEALRWVGDGHARRLGAFAANPNASETACAVRELLLSLGLVAASEHADAGDFVTFASACHALSCWRAGAELAEAGAVRFPAAPEIRGCITQALWSAGRIVDAGAFAERIAERAQTAESEWFTGQAYMFAAEDCRRCDLTERAVSGYRDAMHGFVRALTKNGAFADDCNRRMAECSFGWGMALVRTNARDDAAMMLVQAVESDADVKRYRDGLGYDCFDFVDRLLEWRDAGGESPVTPTGLCDRLAAKAPNDPYWPTAIADACIREALRADGRNPERREKETVDAGGKPIRDKVGLPTPRGDEWLRDAVAIARRAQRPNPADTDAEAKTVLAQACTITAERQIERGRTDGVQQALAEAANVLGAAPPAAAATAGELRQKAAELRAQLGAPRPRFREGR